MAQNWYAQLETDLGPSKDALLRLTARATVNDSDADVFAGLVFVCRYCELLEASVAAHERALEPQMNTSVRHTYWLLGDNARALQGGGGFHFEAMVLAADGTARRRAHHPARVGAGKSARDDAPVSVVAARIAGGQS